MITDIFRDFKIGYLDERAQKFLSSSVETLQSESLSVTLHHLNDGEVNKSSDFLAQTIPSLDVLVDLKDKYVRLKEKFKHDKREQLKIAIDWRDFNEMLNRLLTHKESADAMYFQTRSQEIIARFNKMLNS